MDSVQASEFYRTLIRPQCWRNGASQASASVKARPSGSCTGERGASSNLNHSLCMSMSFWSNSVKTHFDSSSRFALHPLWGHLESKRNVQILDPDLDSPCGAPVRWTNFSISLPVLTTICLEHIRHEDWDMLKLVIRTCFDCERTCCPMNL